MRVVKRIASFFILALAGGLGALRAQDLPSPPPLSVQFLGWLERSREVFHLTPDELTRLLEEQAGIKGTVEGFGNTDDEAFRSETLAQLRAVSPMPLLFVIPNSHSFEFLDEFALRGVDETAFRQCVELLGEDGKKVKWDSKQPADQAALRAWSNIEAVLRGGLLEALLTHIDIDVVRSNPEILGPRVARSTGRTLVKESKDQAWVVFQSTTKDGAVVDMAFRDRRIRCRVDLESLMLRIPLGQVAGRGGVPSEGAKAAELPKKWDMTPHLAGKGAYEVTVFYGTDRKWTGAAVPAEQYSGERGGLEFGKCLVSLPPSHERGQLESKSWKEVFRDARDPQRYVVLLSIKRASDEKSKKELIEQLAQSVTRSSRKQAFVFVHGYNVSFQDAARRTAQIAHDLEFEGAAVMFSWPSDDKTLDYVADKADSEWTTPHFVEFLETVAKGSGAERLHIIAHSMGSQALGYALRDIANSGVKTHFDQIILAAPDIDASVFEDQLARKMTGLCEQLTLYASDHDKALKGAEVLQKYPRAGQAGDGLVVLESLNTIDASAMDTSLLGLGHSYFAELRAMLEDVKKTLNGIAPPARGLSKMEKRGLPYWLMQ